MSSDALAIRGDLRGAAAPVARPTAPAAVGMAGLLTLGITFNGLNSMVGGAIVCAVGVSALSLVLLLWPAPIRFWRRVAPVVVLVGAAVAWAALPMVPLAGAAATALAPDLIPTAMLGVAGYVAVLLCGARIGERRKTMEVAVDALVAFGCVNAVLGLMLRVWAADLPFELWQGRDDDRFTSTLSNANVAGAYYGLLATLCAARLLSVRGTEGWVGERGASLRLAAYALALAQLLGACVITGSRSAAVATIAAVALLALWRTLRRRGGVRWLGLGVIAALGAIIAALGLSDLLVDRLALASSELSLRTLMWRHYAGVVEAAPLHGYGLGVFPTLNAHELTDPRLAQALWMVNSAHNLVLQLLLQAGWPYLLLVTAAAGWVGYGAIRRGNALRWNHASDGIVAAVVLVLACSMIDIALDVPAMVSLTLFLAGLAWGPGDRPSRRPDAEWRRSAA